MRKTNSAVAFATLLLVSSCTTERERCTLPLDISAGDICVLGSLLFSVIATVAVGIAFGLLQLFLRLLGALVKILFKSWFE
ncbi:MAG TPA: hypothetical protein VEZ41_12740 [Allosphingosinicella sp.]|nr:hypothetical protein [Allosphingosinicella sp.]